MKELVKIFGVYLMVLGLIICSTYEYTPQSAKKKETAALDSAPPMMGGGKMKYYKHGGKTRNPFTEQYD